MHVTNINLAYLLWAASFFGFAGLHRMYMGRWITGIIWFLTAGLFLIGTIVDAFLIPGMVREANARPARIA
ncbi:MAG: NINE protein [Planctomycetota bacterium]